MRRLFEVGGIAGTVAVVVLGVINASYLAENVAMFGIVVGIALLLTGIAFGILVLGGPLRKHERAPLFGKRRPESAGTKGVPAA